MKKFSLFALAAAAMLFAACSSEKDVADGGGKQSLLDGNGEGYISVGLSIPMNVVSRAWGESTDLDDAASTAKEYGVTNAYLLLFEGSTESGAVLKQISTLDAFNNGVDPANDQVTINSGDTKFVAKIKEQPSSDLWALAVVNSAGIISPASSASNIVAVNGTDLTGDVTLASLQAEIAMAVGASETYQKKLPFVNSSTGHIFMSNAVLFDKQGGTADPGEAFKGHTLVKVNQDYIYKTYEEASSNSSQKAADIYVERGVAKVTVSGKTDGSDVVDVAATLKEYNKPTATLSAKIVKWALTNTNLKSYDVRKVPTTFTWNLKSYSNGVGGDKFRFVGNTAVDTPYGTAVAGYRTYWAEDPNYGDGVITDLYTAKANDYVTGLGAAKPQYCFENTFNVAHQTVQNTTCVIVEVELSTDQPSTDKQGEKTNLYTVGENKKVLYTKEDIQNMLTTRLFSIPAFQTWFDANHGAGVTELEAGDVTITFDTSKDGKAGVVTITGITVNSSKLKASPEAIPSTVITALQNASVMGEIQRYLGGTAYYYVRIKHFGDDLTPWNLASDDNPEWVTAPKEDAADPIANIYPDAGSAGEHRQDANYLGRYSVVRNNWYDLALKTVSAMGSSTIPDLTTEDHPDDEIDDLYIKARINILSWAKRTQNWDLKK